MENRLIDKLNRKFRKYSIRNLMTIIVFGMAFVFVADLFILPASGYTLSYWLAFDRVALFQGQIWRLVSFIFLPPESSIVFIIFSLYFYWLAGNSLELEWGPFRFNLFYFVGIIGTVIAGLITGYATNSYVNMSLFIAFAILFPDHELRIFFFFPVKIKYLAIVDVAMYLVALIIVPWQGKIALIVSLANLLLFFWKDAVAHIKQAKRRREFKKNWDNYR